MFDQQLYRTGVRGPPGGDAFTSAEVPVTANSLMVEQGDCSEATLQRSVVRTSEFKDFTGVCRGYM